MTPPSETMTCPYCGVTVLHPSGGRTSEVCANCGRVYEPGDSRRSAIISNLAAQALGWLKQAEALYGYTVGASEIAEALTGKQQGEPPMTTTTPAYALYRDEAARIQEHFAVVRKNIEVNVEESMKDLRAAQERHYAIYSDAQRARDLLTRQEHETLSALREKFEREEKEKRTP